MYYNIYSIVFAILLITSMKYSSAEVRHEDLGEGLLKLAELLHNTCINKTGTDDATIDNLRNGNFVDDDKIKKYVACVWMDAQLVRPDGSMNEQLMKDLCPPKIRENGPRIVMQCWKQVKKVIPIEEKIYEMLECYYNIDPENFVVI